jgi:hypothetical protein
MSDRHRRLIAFAVLFMSGMYGMRTLEYVAPPGITGALEILQLVCGALAVLFVVPVFFWKVRNLSGSTRKQYFSEDSYAAEALSRAHVTSWNTTLLLLVFMTVMDRRLAGMPAQFFLDLPLAVMLAVFALRFLYLDREPADETGPARA